jgi:hypothetical protein
MQYIKAMRALLKIAICGVVLAAGAFAYKKVTAQPNEDYRNYEVVFQKLPGWNELPHNPNTLLLMRHPKTKALLRCSATQVVSETNPEPDMDTKKQIKQIVANANENQPEWKTELIKGFDNGKVEFEMFKKTNAGKTIIAALAVRGNTTLLVSISNTGKGALTLAEGNIEQLLDFLKTVDLQVTDKWVKMHERIEAGPHL